MTDGETRAKVQFLVRKWAIPSAEARRLLNAERAQEGSV